MENIGLYQYLETKYSIDSHNPECDNCKIHLPGIRFAIDNEMVSTPTRILSAIGSRTLPKYDI